MNKITAEHLQRSAYVYVRQSTPDQLVHNRESQRRQYALADRARQLGWMAVEIIDDDLGRSGDGDVLRPYTSTADRVDYRVPANGRIVLNWE